MLKFSTMSTVSWRRFLSASTARRDSAVTCSSAARREHVARPVANRVSSISAAKRVCALHLSAILLHYADRYALVQARYA